jgi:hypothetical protein
MFCCGSQGKILADIYSLSCRHCMKMLWSINMCIILYYIQLICVYIISFHFFLYYNHTLKVVIS